MSGRAQHGLSNAIAISLINRFPKKLLTLLEVTVAFTNKYSNTQILRKDARLPVQLQRAMAAEAEAAREARAKVLVIEICSLQNLIQILNN